MKFTDLKPTFLRISNRKKGGQTFLEVESIDKATGVQFHCPKCVKASGGTAGAHSIVCWSPRVKIGTVPGPGRWQMSGSGLDDLTLEPSVNLMSGCGWHGVVKDGVVSNA